MRRTACALFTALRGLERQMLIKILIKELNIPAQFRARKQAMTMRGGMDKRRLRRIGSSKRKAFLYYPCRFLGGKSGIVEPQIVFKRDLALAAHKAVVRILMDDPFA